MDRRCSELGGNDVGSGFASVCFKLIELLDSASYDVEDSPNRQLSRIFCCL